MRKQRGVSGRCDSLLILTPENALAFEKSEKGFMGWLILVVRWVLQKVLTAPPVRLGTLPGAAWHVPPLRHGRPRHFGHLAPPLRPTMSRQFGYPTTTTSAWSRGGKRCRFIRSAMVHHSPHYGWTT